MKIRSLLCGLFAIAAISACNQEEPVVNPSLDVSKTSAAVEAEGGEVTVEVTSNVEWTAKADQDWVTVSPASGNGSEKAVAVKLNVEPNEAEEARTATVTISAEKLSKTVKVTQAGKTVTPGPEPKPEVAWSMMGCFVDNQWASDVPMAQEGEWIVAKGAQFTELTFKIRGNASWDDATNIGYAPGTEKGLVNAKLSVVTAEYSKANLGGDAADIKLNGVAGTYDVYFSFEKLEVYVMEEGYKPGEREPVPAEPKDVTYTVTGTIADHAWENNYEGGLMVAEGDYFVVKNVPFVWNSTLYGGDYNVIELKIVETGTWDAYAYPEKDVMQQVNTEVSLIIGGENVAFAAPEGTYDVYFDKANAKLWVMNAGYKPGETPEPEPAEYDIDGKQWVFTWEALGVPAVFDLGVTAPGAFYFAYDMSAFGDEYAGVWYPFYSGAYTIEKTDGTSGVINVVLIDPYEGTELSAAIPYTMSSENEATFDTSALKAQLEVTSVTATPASEVIDLTGGGQESEYLADGDYWIVSGGKVATPVTSSGALQTVDAVDGRSTAANAFTFRMIDEAETLYSIKDANGMYLYLEASGNFGTSAAIDYKDDAFCWQIYPMGDGTYYIANYNTMGTVQLASDNSFVCVEDMVGVYPELILAENPVVEQPEVPADPAVKETIWKGEPFDLGSDWSKGLQINSVPRLPEDARIHVVYEAPAGYDYYQFKFCYVDQEWQWVPLTSPTGMNADGCVTLDAAATEYSFALNAEDIAAINSGRGLVVQGYAAIIKEVYYTSEIEVGDGPKVIWEGREELLSDWSTALQIQNMPHLESGMSIYVEYEASGYDYYQFKFCYIDQNWGWNAMTSPVDVNEYGCVMLDPQKTEYVLALNDEDIAAINAGKGMVIQGYGAVITKVSYK